MNNKQFNLVKKLLFDQRIEYLFWGVMTTLVYFVVRFATMMVFKSEPEIPVIISEVVSIAFAFLVNKYFVFNTESQSKSLKIQIINFLAGRIISMLIDMGITFVVIQKFPSFFVHLFHLEDINYQFFFFKLPVIHGLMGSPILMNNFICVIFIQVFIIVFNYIVSKYFAFN